MASPLDKIKETVDKQMAGVQADIGRFLMQKQAILTLPPGYTRDSLLSNQNALEKRSTDTLSEAMAIKEEASAPFDPFNISSYSKFAPLTSKAIAIGKKLVALKVAMALHVAEVAKATGQAVPKFDTPIQPGGGLSWLVYGSAFAAGLWAWNKWGKK